MRNKYTLLLYIFIFILVFAGLGLMFMRQAFVDNLRNATGVSAVDVAVRRSLPDNELIDTEILQGERLSSLTNNVKVFVFEEICGESINTPKKCSKGNGNPFLKK